MNRIQSKNHNIGIYRINKLSLSCYKICILEYGYVRLSYFKNLIVNHAKIILPNTDYFNF